MSVPVIYPDNCRPKELPPGVKDYPRRWCSRLYFELYRYGFKVKLSEKANELVLSATEQDTDLVRRI